MRGGRCQLHASAHCPAPLPASLSGAMALTSSSHLRIDANRTLAVIERTLSNLASDTAVAAESLRDDRERRAHVPDSEVATGGLTAWCEPHWPLARPAGLREPRSTTVAHPTARRARENRRAPRRPTRRGTRSEREHGGRWIVVGYDGSEAADRALLRAADDAGERDAVVIVTSTTQLYSAARRPNRSSSRPPTPRSSSRPPGRRSRPGPLSPMSSSSRARAILPRSCSRSPARRTPTSSSSVAAARTSWRGRCSARSPRALSSTHRATCSSSPDPGAEPVKPPDAHQDGYLSPSPAGLAACTLPRTAALATRLSALRPISPLVGATGCKRRSNLVSAIRLQRRPATQPTSAAQREHQEAGARAARPTHGPCSARWPRASARTGLRPARRPVAGAEVQSRSP